MSVRIKELYLIVMWVGVQNASQVKWESGTSSNTVQNQGRNILLERSGSAEFPTHLFQRVGICQSASGTYMYI